MDYMDSLNILGFFSTYILAISISGVAILVLSVIAFWKIFEKAGRPGWASIIPIYSYIVLLEIVGRPGWWVIFFFIPVANVVFYIIVFCFDLAKVFGRGGGFSVGLFFVNIVFLLILGFDENIRYIGPIAGVPAYAGIPPYQNNYGGQPQPPVSQSNYSPQPRYSSQQTSVERMPVAQKPTKPKVAAWLIDSKGRTIQLFQGETTIGKMSENDIQPRDTTVSRRHAKIVERNGHFSIVDLGSTNGTRVNGKIISGAYSLTADDEIQIGDNTKFYFKN